MANSKSKKNKAAVSSDSVVDSAAKAENATASSQKKAAVKTVKKTEAKVSTGKKSDEVKKADAKKSNKKPNILKRFTQYLKEVRTELKRVTWPTKQDIIKSSLVVVGALVFFGLLIFAIDSAVVPLLTAYSGLAQ